MFFFGVVLWPELLLLLLSLVPLLLLLPEGVDVLLFCETPPLGRSRLLRLSLSDDELELFGTWSLWPRRTVFELRLLQDRILLEDVRFLDAIPSMVSPERTVYEFPHE